MGAPEFILQTHASMSPAWYAPLDGVPFVAAAAISKRLEVLWCNDAFASIAGQRPLPKAPLIGCLPVSVVRPIEGLMQHHELRPGGFVQMVRGRRSYVRAWPLDTEAFGAGGIFLVIEPAVLQGDVEPAFPFVEIPDLGDLDALSPRELEVLWYTAAGLSAAETAEKLSRSVRTVENHIASVHHKLGVSRRAELTRLAVERGVLAFTREEWGRIVEQAA